MNIKPLLLGEIGTNCYIIYADDGSCAVIDPAFDAPKILAMLKKLELVPAYILLTHAHFDHVGAVKELRAATGALIAIAEPDAEMLRNPNVYSSGRVSDERYVIEPDILLHDGDKLTFGSLTVNVYITPGHTKGSALFVCDNSIFSGDTLFREDVGRTDLYGGSDEEQVASLRRIISLFDRENVYPGHGEFTDMRYEKEHNEYLSDKYL